MPDLAAPAAVARGNLPVALTGLIGREQDLAEARRLLGEARLLTLTGAGGVGKSRLALALAAAVADDFADTVWLVELAALADPQLVAPTVARALGAPEQPGRPAAETLVAWLADRPALLVLDNCEHLLDACAALAGALLTACPALRLLATSRMRLRVPGEVSWQVRSLALPPVPAGLASAGPPALAAIGASAAVRLFVARAAAVEPGFALTADTAPAVAQVCQQLDGIPLALELAAARVAALPVAAIAGRLDQAFGLLTGGNRTALPRHRTLRAAIDWGYALLTPAERVLFRRLAVFAGGWDLAAADAVCAGDGLVADRVLELLAELVDGSLVQHEPRGGEARYRLLETVRQYAAERLRAADEEARLRDQHAACYLALAEQAAPHLGESEQGRWLERLDREHDNLRAALRWTAERGAAEPLLRLAAALSPFWSKRGHWTEGRVWLAQALAIGAGLAVPARATVLGEAAWYEYRLGDEGRAAALIDEALALARALGERPLVAQLLDLALVVLLRREEARMLAVADEALALYRALDDDRGIGRVLRRLSRFYVFTQGDAARGIALLEECLPYLRRSGDQHELADAAEQLGSALRLQGDLDRAGVATAEAEAAYRAMGSMQGLVHALADQGELDWARGDAAGAVRSWQASLTLARDLGKTMHIILNLGLLGVAAATGGQVARAARLWGAAEAYQEVRGMRLIAVERAQIEREVAAVRERLDAEAFATAWDEGRALPVAVAIAEALALAPPSDAPAASATSASSTGPPDPLTPREREIAALLARGWSNRRLAAELSISEHTVRTHVTAILGKLGLTGRAQVALWAVAHGLVAPPHGG